MSHIQKKFNELRKDYSNYNAECYSHFLEDCKVEDVLANFECTYVEPFAGCDFTKEFLFSNSFSVKELNFMKESMENYIRRSNKIGYRNHDHLEQVEECVSLVQDKLDLIQYMPEVEVMLESLYFSQPLAVMEAKGFNKRPKNELRKLMSKRVPDETKLVIAKNTKKDVEAGKYAEVVASALLLTSLTFLITVTVTAISMEVLVILVSLPLIIVTALFKHNLDNLNGPSIKALNKSFDKEIKRTELAIRKGKGGKSAKDYLRELRKAKALLNEKAKAVTESSYNENGELSFQTKMNEIDLAINENAIRFIFSENETVEESIQWLNNIELLTNVKEQLQKDYVLEAKGKAVDHSVSKLKVSVAKSIRGSINSLKSFKSTFESSINKCETDKEIASVDGIFKAIKSKVVKPNLPATFKLDTLLGNLADELTFEVNNKEENKKIQDWINGKEYNDIIRKRKDAISGKTRKQVQRESSFEEFDEDLEDFDFDLFDEEYVLEGSKHDERRKKANKNLNKIKKVTHNVKGDIKKAGQSGKAVLHQVKKAGDAIDDGLTNSVNAVKQSYRNDMRDEIIEDKTRIKLSRIIRKAITAPVAIVAAPAIKAISAITGKAIHSPKEKERLLILRELEEELEIVEEKIEDSRGDSDKEKKYQLMRIRNQLKRDIARIRFKTTSHKKGL